jgi:hypothetical protein
LLPWYAAGTLRRRDRLRVEQALRSDADIARQLDLVREELAETIHFNETLGAPAPCAADRLMAAIDAETLAARKRAPPGALAGWLTGFFANLSPRTLAMAASFAMLAIALQAVMLVDIFTKPDGSSLQDFSSQGVSSQGSSSQGSSPPGQMAQAPSAQVLGAGHGTFAMVRFARQASAGEITNFLQNYQATLVDGPTPGGLYRVKVAVTSLAKEEVGRLIARIRQEHVVESAEPSE